MLVAVSVIFNLGLLGFFKYYDFFQVSFQRLLGVWNDPWLLKILLAVGISFYTFQSMSYVIGIYRGKIQPCQNFILYALYSFGSAFIAR